MDSPFLKDASEGASATEAGREFHNGIVRGKKLNLNESEDVEYCLLNLNLNLNSLLVKRQVDNPSPGAVTGGN